MNDHLNRRSFIKRSGLVGAGITAAQFLPRRFLQAQQPADDVINPLAHYPNRDWEKLYRNQYAYDHAFSWVCAPNDTHNCRIAAHARNGVIVRLGEQFDINTYTDLYGNHATANWGNRHCAKGYTFHRILYGPYRLKHPIVRRGWKRWADDGFPELTAEVKARYKFDSRGTDKFERLTWDDAFSYIARATKAIAARYSGAAGAKLLADQGYPKEMIDDMGGAGTRTIKMRGGMGLLGVLGKYGMYRLCNSLALLDVHIGAGLVRSLPRNLRSRRITRSGRLIHACIRQIGSYEENRHHCRHPIPRSAEHRLGSHRHPCRYHPHIPGVRPRVLGLFRRGRIG